MVAPRRAPVSIDSRCVAITVARDRLVDSARGWSRQLQRLLSLSRSCPYPAFFERFPIATSRY